MIRDNEQGKRYGRRGPMAASSRPTASIFRPSPLRYDEFIRIAAEAKVERERMKALRKRATIARRADPAGRRGACKRSAPCPRIGSAGG